MGKKKKLSNRLNKFHKKSVNRFKEVKCKTSNFLDWMSTSSFCGYSFRFLLVSIPILAVWSMKVKVQSFFKMIGVSNEYVGMLLAFMAVASLIWFLSYFLGESKPDIIIKDFLIIMSVFSMSIPLLVFNSYMGNYVDMMFEKQECENIVDKSSPDDVKFTDVYYCPIKK